MAVWQASRDKIINNTEKQGNDDVEYKTALPNCIFSRSGTLAQLFLNWS